MSHSPHTEPTRAPFSFRLSTLLLVITLAAASFGLTPLWHQWWLNSREPYSVDDEGRLWDGTSAWPYYQTTGRDVYARHTWRFSTFFFAAALGLMMALHARVPVCARRYGWALAWPLYVLPMSIWVRLSHGMGNSNLVVEGVAILYFYVGPVVALALTARYWVVRRSDCLAGLFLMMFQLLWMGHLYVWLFDYAGAYGD